MARKTPKQKKSPKAARKDKAARLKGRKAQVKADAKAVHGELPQWTKVEIEEAFRRFAAANPAPRSELQHMNPFTLLVAVVLSAQATDAGVNKATPALFALADTPEQMAKLGEAKVRDLIKTIGLFRTKAKNVIGLSQQLIEKHGGKVPHDREALEALPGVGRKTANVVLNIAFGEPTIAVDTHIFRVGNRTGLAVGKTPLDVEMKLMEVVPEHYRLHAHHWLILHGRYTCIARRPLCEKCIIADLCKWPGKTVNAPPVRESTLHRACACELPLPSGERVGVRGLRPRGCTPSPLSSPPWGEGEESQSRTLSFPGYFLLRHNMQGRAVDLVGGGERQFVDEPDEARVLVGRRVGEREALDRLGVERALRDDESDRLLALDVVVDRHDGGLGDRGMALQHALDVGRDKCSRRRRRTCRRCGRRSNRSRRRRGETRRR